MGGVAPRLIDYIYPLGSVLAFAKDVDPNQIYTHQTWERFAKGRTLVGVNEIDTNFKTAGKIGGEKTHKLTMEELPKGRPRILAHSTSGSDYSASGADLAFHYGSGLKGYTGYGMYLGSDTPHNNLQPYVTVYYWKRTA